MGLNVPLPDSMPFPGPWWQELHVVVSLIGLATAGLFVFMAWLIVLLVGCQRTVNAGDRHAFVVMLQLAGLCLLLAAGGLYLAVPGLIAVLIRGIMLVGRGARIAWHRPEADPS